MLNTVTMHDSQFLYFGVITLVTKNAAIPVSIIVGKPIRANLVKSLERDISHSFRLVFFHKYSIVNPKTIVVHAYHVIHTAGTNAIQRDIIFILFSFFIFAPFFCFFI